MVAAKLVLRLLGAVALTAPLRAFQILLGPSKIENTVRYLGIDVEDALALAENTEI
jgi:hypothetical protein